MSRAPHHLGKYELQERLGSGGMAEVWKAFDPPLQRHVAIKILHANLQDDPNFLTRFEREAQVIASLHHPNIVKIHDFHISRPPESDTPLAYMIMDYVEGQTMTHYLRSTSRLGKFPSPADLVRLFTPICLAVDYAHQKGMIHRDLKPSNILLDQRTTPSDPIGEPILSDFGIAKLLGTSTNSFSGGWFGTPLYTAPEQLMGSAGNELSDIYALGIILYETCTGVLPFQGDNPAAIGMQHLNATPMAPALLNPHLPPDLIAVIMRGLAKVPQQRFPSAAALAVALADALQMPISESVRQTASQIAAMNSPTYISPVPFNLSLNAASGSPSTPSQSSQGRAPSSPLYATPPGGGTNTPSSLLAGAAGTSPARNGAQSAEAASSPPPAASVSTPTPSVTPVIMTPGQQALTSSSPSVALLEKGRKRWISPAIILLFVLLGASLGTLLLLASKPAASPALPAAQTVGHVFFVSSGLLNPDNSQGINDELLLDLHNLSPPQTGKAYYAWLLGDKSQSESTTTALGQVVLDHGNVHLLYQGNQSHRNLLLDESRFLITEEEASVHPATFSPDYRAWRYYAEISQAASPKDKLHFTMLDHLRHLTSESPELKIRGLHGGLDMWLLRNTQKVLEWANAARDSWRNNADLLHRHLIRILDYLDGAASVQKDAPAVGTTLLVDPHDAQVPLLGPVPDGQDPPGYSFDNEVPPGYVYLVSSHLAGAVLSPDATQDQRALAAQIHLAIDQVKSWLEQVHQDAKQLLPMTPDQLAQPSTLSLLDDMVTQTQYAYHGQVDPLTGQLQGGATWISSNIQRMANFDVKPYVAQ